MFKTFYSTSDWRNDPFFLQHWLFWIQTNFQATEKKANMSNKNALQGENVRTSCISLRIPDQETNKHGQHTENSRLEPAIRNVQKLAQNVFPPWHSWILTSISGGPSSRSWLFISATVRIVFLPAQKYGTNLSDMCRSASFRHRNRAATTIPVRCEQKPCMTFVAAQKQSGVVWT